MGKGDIRTKRGKLINKSYGIIRPKDCRKRNLISFDKFRKWSLERLYVEIGRFDYTVAIVFIPNTPSYQKFGRMITGQLYYKKSEDQLLKIRTNSGIKYETNGKVLFTTLLKENLSKDKIKLLETTGFDNIDILDLSYYAYKQNPTYFKKKNKKLADPIIINVRNENSYSDSYKMIYYLFCKRIDEGDYLIEFEKLNMMAIQKALRIPQSNPKYIFIEIMNERQAEFDYLVEEILIWIEEIKSYSDEVLKRKLELIKKIVDYEFNKAGVNTEKPLEIVKHLGLYSGLLQIGMQYQDEIILYGTTPKVVLDFKGFLHVAFRHCDVCNIGSNNVNKSRIPYKLADLKRLIKSCLHLLEDEINDHFKKYPDKRFSKFKDRLIRFNGNYYTIHINTNGVIETFYNHDK